MLHKDRHVKSAYKTILLIYTLIQSLQVVFLFNPKGEKISEGTKQFSLFSNNREKKSYISSNKFFYIALLLHNKSQMFFL